MTETPSCTVRFPVLGGFNMKDDRSKFVLDDIGWLFGYKILSYIGSFFLGILVTTIVFETRVRLSNKIPFLTPKETKTFWKYGLLSGFGVFVLASSLKLYSLWKSTQYRHKLFKGINANDNRPCVDENGRVWRDDDVEWQMLF